MTGQHEDETDARCFGATTRFAVLGVAAIELLRTAWISDDALITVRSVLNLIHGHGPTFNVEERVQAFTHPLWFLMASAAGWVSGNVVVALLVLSVGVSLLNLWLFLRFVASSPLGGLVAAAGLLLSKSYVDYSTSGLENPLTHLLLLSTTLAASRASAGDRFWFSLAFLAVGALYLSRPDAVLLGVPVLFALWNRARPSPGLLVRALIVGALPAMAWTLFSLFYYGFPFPNTAYAKLATGVATEALAAKGVWYLVQSWANDPVSAVLVGLGIVLGIRARAELRALALGLVVYLLFLILVGGDFMAGRFLTPLGFSAAVIVARTRWRTPDLIPVAALIGLAGCATFDQTVAASLEPPPERRTFWGDVADERQYYFDERNLLRAPQSLFASRRWSAEEDRRVRISCGGLGLMALRSGPGTHFVDECALTDPLLARLPAILVPMPRAGHYFRRLPEGYLASLEQGVNRLEDPSLARYYDQLRVVTRGPLFSVERMRVIASLNFRQRVAPSAPSDTAPRGERVVKVEEVAKQMAEADGGSAAAGIEFQESLLVRFRRPERVRVLEFSLDRGGIYRVEMSQSDSWKLVGYFGPGAEGELGLERYVHSFSDRRPLVRSVRIAAVHGTVPHRMDHLALTSQ